MVDFPASYVSLPELYGGVWLMSHQESFSQKVITTKKTIQCRGSVG